MSQSRLKRWGRRLRIGFRVLRCVIWVLLIAVLLSVLYLNRVGLPDFAKKRVQDQLHSRGVDLEFSRLRLRFDQGVVAEDVRFSGLLAARGLTATAKAAQLELDWNALRDRKLRVAGFRVGDGQIRWEATETNREPRSLTLDRLQVDFLLRTNDVWELANLEARFAGIGVRFNGAITNASTWREGGRGRASRPAAESVERFRARLFAIAEQLERIRFAAPPEIRASLHGDLRDGLRWEATLALTASGAETPWGIVTNALLNARLLPPDAKGLRRAEISVEAGEVRTPWAEADSVMALLKLTDVDATTNRVAAELSLRTSRAQTRWAQSGPVEVNARWQQTLTNEIPQSGDFNLLASSIETRWGKLSEARLGGHWQEPSRSQAVVADASWGFWRFLEPHALTVKVELGQFTTPKLTVDGAKLDAHWDAPRLELAQLEARLYQGGVRGTGTVDVVTRQVQSRAEMDFDLQQFAPLMTPRGVEWLRQFSWDKPPHASGLIGGVLPAWTNQSPDWRGEVLPTLTLDGEFKVGRGAFRDIPADSAASHVSYSNMIWRLPDLVATRPEGVVHLEHIADDRTREYYFKFDSTIDPQALRPVVATDQQRGFDLVQFGELPLVNGEVWGRWRRPELVGIAGTVAVSNLTFRSETGLVLRAAVQYTNRVFTAHSVEAWQGGRSARADGLEVNVAADCLYLTNATGNVDPMVIARTIGPKTAKSFEPYHFLNPPDFVAAGTIPLHNTNDVADLSVQLRGGPFAWWKVKVPQISGTVRWQGETLALTNVQAAFYDGTAAGDAQFDLKSETGTRMRFDLLVTNANLQAFLADTKTGRSNVQGIVTGRLTITDAVSTNWQTWNGHGEMQMRDGLLWDVPLFGILFSPVLNVAVPGAKLGNSRATEATATFGMTNGVVHTDDMKVGTTLMVLFLEGDVTLDGRLDGRVEASLLREMWVLGRVISLILSPVTKALEYRVTGSLQSPKVVPYYGPARLLLQPLRTLKDTFAPGSNAPKPEETAKPKPGD